MNELPISERVRVIRERKKLSQNALGKRAGVVNNTVRAIEAGNNVQVNTLRQVLNVLGYDIRIVRQHIPKDASRLMTTHD